MKRLLALLASLAAMVAAVAATAAAVAAAATPAKKVPLTKTNRDCDGIPPPGTPVETKPFGFVNLIKPADNKLVAATVVQGATASATYKVRLIQSDQDGVVLSVCCAPPDCHSNYDGALVTDSSGDGNANIQAAVIKGAASVWVDLNNQADFSDFVNAYNFLLRV